MANSRNNLVYICSPYRGDVKRNKEYARYLTRVALDNGFVPVTVHLYLTEVTNEDDPAEREKGMAAGMEILKHCKYILIGDKYGISSGMNNEIWDAQKDGIIRLTEKDGSIVPADQLKVKREVQA